MEVYRSLIGGAWRVSPSSERVPNLNPADPAEVLGLVPLSEESEAQAAADAAGSVSAEWRRVPLAERAALVARAARLLEARSVDIARTATREQGKLPHEAAAEVARAVALVEQAAGLAGAAGPAAPATLRDTFGYSLRRPLGVAALFPSWTAPIADPAAAIAAALVAGNTAVIKPAMLTPATAALVAQCFLDAGAPPGTLNLVCGSPALAAALLGHDAVRAVWHAGGPAGVAELRTLAAPRGLALRSEGGGRGVAVVLEDADLDRAVVGVAQAAFGEAGQRRGAVSLVALAHPVADAFLEKLVGVLAAMQPGADIGPLVSEERLDAVLAQVDRARDEGAELLYGGRRVSQGGFFMRPAVLDRCRPEMRAVSEPVLGPLLAVVRVEGFEEAMAAVAGQNLAVAAIYARDATRIFRFVEETDAASVCVNTAGSEAPIDMGALLGFFSASKTISLRY